MAAPLLRGVLPRFGHHSSTTSSDGAAASIFNSQWDIPTCRAVMLCVPHACGGRAEPGEPEGPSSTAVEPGSGTRCGRWPFRMTRPLVPRLWRSPSQYAQSDVSSSKSP